MSDFYEFDFYDWSSKVDNRKFWGGAWRNYDIILGTTLVCFDFTKRGVPKSDSETFLSKVIAVAHCPVFDHPHYKERIVHRDGPIYCGVTKQVVDNMFDKYGVVGRIAPKGIELLNFYPSRKISKIKTIGFVGDPFKSDLINEVKRPEMFLDIAAQSGLKPVFIYGKPQDSHRHLYDEIDCLVVTSIFEGVATGIAEAGVCDIPVISTRVGYANDLTSIKTFDTIDEACQILANLNNDSGLLETYIHELSNEIRAKYNWNVVVNDWHKIIEERLRT